MKKVHNTFNILFVCRHNRFRSKFAESYFKKINKNPQIVAKSAGIFPGKYPLNENEVKGAKKLGVELSGKPQPVSTELLEWNDLIVVITNDLPSPQKLFNYEKYKNNIIVWKIKDDKSETPKEINEILKKIEKKVQNLNKSFEKIDNKLNKKSSKNNAKKTSKNVSSY